jgi:hypothetical protein
MQVPVFWHVISYSQVKIYPTLEDKAACAFTVLLAASDSSETSDFF